MKVHRYVIVNVPINKEREFLVALHPLIKKGIISANNIHQMTEEERKN